MPPIHFRDIFEQLRQVNPDQPIGLLIPEAIGHVVLGPSNIEQASSIQITPTERLSYTFGPNWLRLYMNYNWSGDDHDVPHFSAEREPQEPYLRFSVRRTLAPFSTDTHPYIYPSRLLEAGITYHERQLQRPLQILTGSWESDSDSVNYAVYHAARRSGASKADAAFRTWTGGQAKRHNFNKVKVRESLRHEDTIYADFRRSRRMLKLYK